MTESQNRDLWFTLPPQRSLLVLWLFSVIPIPILKFQFFIHLVIIFVAIMWTSLEVQLHVMFQCHACSPCCIMFPLLYNVPLVPLAV